MRKIEFNYTNEFGEKFSISQEVEDDWCGFDEKEFLNNAYLTFLSSLSFAVDTGDRIVIINDGECEDCDCCSDCDLNYDDCGYNFDDLEDLEI
jgi:hypothetical protein